MAVCSVPVFGSPSNFWEYIGPVKLSVEAASMARRSCSSSAAYVQGPSESGLACPACPIPSLAASRRQQHQQIVGNDVVVALEPLLRLGWPINEQPAD